MIRRTGTTGLVPANDPPRRYIRKRDRVKAVCSWCGENFSCTPKPHRECIDTPRGPTHRSCDAERTRIETKHPSTEAVNR